MIDIDLNYIFILIIKTTKMSIFLFFILSNKSIKFTLANIFKKKIRLAEICRLPDFFTCQTSYLYLIFLYYTKFKESDIFEKSE